MNETIFYFYDMNKYCFIIMMCVLNVSGVYQCQIRHWLSLTTTKTCNNQRTQNLTDNVCSFFRKRIGILCTLLPIMTFLPSIQKRFPHSTNISSYVTNQISILDILLLWLTVILETFCYLIKHIHCNIIRSVCHRYCNRVMFVIHYPLIIVFLNLFLLHNV